MVRVVLGAQHLHQSLDLRPLPVVVVVEGPDLPDNVGHLIDGVVPPLRGGAVAADALHVHPDLHAAPVAPVNAAVGGLRGHHELRRDAVLVVDVLPAQAVAVLLLDRGRHQDRVPLGDEAQVLHDLRPVHGGHHAALLVRAAPAVDDVLGLIALVGVLLPVEDVANAHGVDMPVKGDDLVPLAHPAQRVALGIDLRAVKAQPLHLQDRALDDPLLAAALAGNGDQVPQEFAHVLPVALRCPLDALKVHRSRPPFHVFSVNILFLERKRIKKNLGSAGAAGPAVGRSPVAAPLRTDAAAPLYPYHSIENAVVKQFF